MVCALNKEGGPIWGHSWSITQKEEFTAEPVYSFSMVARYEPAHEETVISYLNGELDKTAKAI